MLHQNESLQATSVAAAKAIYSQLVLEAKNNFSAVFMEAKTNGPFDPRSQGSLF